MIFIIRGLINEETLLCTTALLLVASYMDHSCDYVYNMVVEVPRVTSLIF